MQRLPKKVDSLSDPFSPLGRVRLLVGNWSGGPVSDWPTVAKTLGGYFACRTGRARADSTSKNCGCGPQLHSGFTSASLTLDKSEPRAPKRQRRVLALGNVVLVDVLRLNLGDETGTDRLPAFTDGKADADFDAHRFV